MACNVAVIVNIHSTFVEINRNEIRIMHISVIASAKLQISKRTTKNPLVATKTSSPKKMKGKRTTVDELQSPPSSSALSAGAVRRDGSYILCDAT